jgi:hypothetical protein
VYDTIEAVDDQHPYLQSLKEQKQELLRTAMEWRKEHTKKTK